MEENQHMLETVKQKAFEILQSDNSGHGIEHINRVLELSLKFADKENADKNIVSLIALLHDVDDYKLFGAENSKQLINARNILSSCNVNEEIQNQVLEEISRIGYSKILKGETRPQTIEGQIVSDADMCDSLGVNGVIRTYTYSMKHGNPFFDRKYFPIEDINAEEYTKECVNTSVCHIFEKILKLKNLMMTNSGKKEAESRHQIVVDMLYHLFEEEDAPEWTEYLDKYLQQNKNQAAL